MKTKYNKTWLGTELKMHIGFQYPADPLKKLKDMPKFEAVFFTDDPEKYCKVTSTHGDGNPDFIIEGNEVYAPVETALTGPGLLKLKLSVWFEQYPYGPNDERRKEVAVCETNVYIEDAGFEEERD